jgi:toxin ParE1/3/4
MREYKLEILKPAWLELEEIAEYHMLMVGPSSAKRITDKILKNMERLIRFPLSGNDINDEELKLAGYRTLICDKYICIYRFFNDTIFIYHIVHGSRDYPGLFKL